MKDGTRRLLQKIIFVIIVLAAWEITAKAHVFGDRSELIFPTLETISSAFVKNFVRGYAGNSLWIYLWNSMKLLGLGILIGVSGAFLFSGLSMVSRTFHNLFNFVVAIADLLPGVALLPVVVSKTVMVVEPVLRAVMVMTLSLMLIDTMSEPPVIM